MKISQLLKIQKGITALIGGGGKTTLMYRLAQELSKFGTVIVCTSTKIIEPEGFEVITEESEEMITDKLKSRRIVCVGTRVAGGKLSASVIGFDRLKELADYVIVEADGAHRLPIKAHAEYEPVIPKEANRTILVMGADAFGQSIGQICHRAELFAAIANVDIQSIVTPEIVSRVIKGEGYGDRLFINKVEDETAMANARALAALSELPTVAGSLQKEEAICLR